MHSMLALFVAEIALRKAVLKSKNEKKGKWERKTIIFNMQRSPIASC